MIDLKVNLDKSTQHPSLLEKSTLSTVLTPLSNSADPQYKDYIAEETTSLAHVYLMKQAWPMAAR